MLRDLSHYEQVKVANQSKLLRPVPEARDPQ